MCNSKHTPILIIIHVRFSVCMCVEFVQNQHLLNTILCVLYYIQATILQKSKFCEIILRKGTTVRIRGEKYAQYCDLIILPSQE